jgi:acetate kinase
MSADDGVLALNAGSSSIKFALYRIGEPLERKLWGKLDRIGLAGTALVFRDSAGDSERRLELGACDAEAAPSALLEWLEQRAELASLRAVGHRLVHGMSHGEPERVTPALLAELERMRAYDPDHLPRELALIDALRRRHPELPQLACFDTAFHRTLPRVARLLPIPRRYEASGVQRYGFHGLSYAYVTEELARLGDSLGRAVVAHLGSGASLAAVRDGRSIDTSMGFTPTSGMMMGTRSGDLDPGVARYWARAEQKSAEQVYELLNRESGLLGVSETSSDLRDLLAREAADVRAREAVALFCYQAKKWIGGYAAALGGLDTLVFTAGIGENAPVIRERICDGLGFLGVELDRERNAQGAPVISSDAGRVKVRVIRTDEELMIAKHVTRALGLRSEDR